MLDLDKFEYPEWMRPPGWRWMEAFAYLVNPERSLNRVIGDTLLFEAVQFARLQRSIPDGSFFKQNYPELFEAFCLSNSHNDCALKWLVEAAVMAGVPEKEIAKQAALKKGERAIYWYKKLFFDVDHYLDKDWLVLANIVSTALTRISAHREFDLTWKLIAYKFGYDMFYKFISPREQTPKEVIDWLKEEVRNRVTAHSFHITNDFRLMYNEQALNMLRTASCFYDIPDAKQEAVEQMSNRAAVKELLTAVEITVKDAKERVSPLEPLRNIDYINDFGGFVDV
jgi:hypothetical protein